MRYIRSFFMALSMFSVIPAPRYKWEKENTKNILKFYPFVGAIIGALWVLLYSILNWFNINDILISAVLLIYPIMITGMLHLDGFMDICDAILSRRDRETKLKILKDSCTGAFSVICLVILMIIQFASIYSIIEDNKNILFLLFIPIISRSFMALMILTKTEIKESTLVKIFKDSTNTWDRVLQIIILIITFIVIYLTLGVIYNGIMLIMCLIMLYKTDVNIKELGGINGDVAGYGLIVGECVGILMLAVF
ncbi:adenosylcobinamide-GDP ribazoletransferase [Clostridium sardiniense]|uniref:adenosylcobinamide-GDP ribazoletransferase n=1 Tax=Clostridium sardiniense TaxID=29369 RepID=UPI001957A6E7|nr:adenosylcobinamide-GDP ribazoletransferase [Clostridium sardiniense]MBM7835194.1 adenosylcobinamide-GDP ribazoletransferase [Clostridium sardiniense]